MIATLCALSGEAFADHPCLASLDRMNVPYSTGEKRRGIDIPVVVTGDIGGITYATWNDSDLILDCSLVYSLARAGRYLREAGITKVLYTSAYQRRTIRGTRRPSSHSFGLAIDVHELHGDTRGRITVKDHYEQGLGDAIDCVGAPLTLPGALLRLVVCRMQRSLLFRVVLDPDFDEDHFNHFHIEARPWDERDDLAPDRA